MSETIKEIKYSIYLLLGLLISFFITGVFPILLIYNLNFKILGFIILYFLITYFLYKIFKTKFFEYLYSIPLLPFHLFFELLTYAIPVNLVTMNVFLYLSFPVMIVSYASIGLTYFHSPINFELKLYLSFLFVYLFYVNCNKLMLGFVAKISPARYKDSKKLKPYNIKEISEYLLSQDNLKIIIYTFNFLAIILINIYKFQNLTFFDQILLFEKPILQSLVTFIAFDRAITLFKGLTFKPSELLNKIMTGIKNKKESIK